MNVADIKGIPVADLITGRAHLHSIPLFNMCHQGHVASTPFSLCTSRMYILAGKEKQTESDDINATTTISFASIQFQHSRHLHIPHNCYLIAFHWVSSGYMYIISAQAVSLPTSEWSTLSGIKAMASRHVIIAPDQISKSILSGFNCTKRHPR